MIKEPLDLWLSSSILGRAQRQGIISTKIISLLEQVSSHHKIDDTPYGGGAGELMRIDIIAPLIKQALDLDTSILRSQKRVILLDPSGQTFNHKHAERLADYKELIFVCGRFEGIDARIYYYIDEALSLGDFVMSCGDLAALSIFDATARLVPGVLGNTDSLIHESHNAGRLENSNYTRPASYENLNVPEVLQKGNHELIAAARKLESLLKTRELRPDLLEKIPLCRDELLLLENNTSYTNYPWKNKL